MNINLTSSEGLIKVFDVTISSDDIQSKKNNYIKARASKIKIDGFRPGKAPVAMIEARLGGDALNHALKKSVDAALDKIIQDHSFRANGQPDLKLGEFEEGKDLTFTVTYECMPEIQVASIGHIELEKIIVDVSEKDVDESLDRLHKEYKGYKVESDRAVQKDDKVKGRLSLIGQDGKPVSGYQKIDVDFVVGTGDFAIPQTEKEVIGKKAGEHLSFTAKTSDNLSDQKVSGKEFTIEFDVVEVLAPVKHKKDDAFAKEFNKETLADLRDALKERVANEFNSVARLYSKRRLLDALEKEYSFDLPPSMVKNEFDNIWGHLQREMDAAKARGDEIDHEGKTDDEIRAEYESIARRRVKLGLLVSHIAQKEKILLNQEEIREAIFKEAMRYPNQMMEVMEFYRKNPRMIDRIAAPMMEDKVVDFLLTQVVLKDVTLGINALKEKVKGVIPTAFDEDDVNEENAA